MTAVHEPSRFANRWRRSWGCLPPRCWRFKTILTHITRPPLTPTPKPPPFAKQVEAELGLPASQVLALFNKAVRRLHGHLRAAKEAEVRGG